MSYTTTEDAPQFEVCLTLVSGVLDSPINLTISSNSGTAQPPGDYDGQPIDVIGFQDDVCLDISIVQQDSIVENTESFTLSLMSTATEVTLDPNTATVEIIDDGDSIAVGFEQSVYNFIEDVGNGSVSLEIQMGSLERDVEILLMSIDGTATSPEDYESFSSVVSFTSGDMPGSTVSLTFQIVDSLSPVVRPGIPCPHRLLSPSQFQHHLWIQLSSYQPPMLLSTSCQMLKNSKSATITFNGYRMRIKLIVLVTIIYSYTYNSP